MSDSTGNDSGNANYPGKSLDNTRPISERFNLDAETVMKIGEASPHAQQKAHMLLEVRDERMELERKSQQRSHQFRVNREKVRLFENYIREDAPRPNDPAARENDIRVIHDEAERMVCEKEAQYLQNIEYQTKKGIEQVLTRDREGPAHERSGHAHER